MHHIGTSTTLEEAPHWNKHHIGTSSTLEQARHWNKHHIGKQAALVDRIPASLTCTKNGVQPKYRKSFKSERRYCKECKVSYSLQLFNIRNCNMDECRFVIPTMNQQRSLKLNHVKFKNSAVNSNCWQGA
ncbi:hypothetical protein FHG87_020115 [Trinorchestia longiramus]|nr:hypothetical protein FHG87_020115 [Trinorchestia longiramus]